MSIVFVSRFTSALLSVAGDGLPGGVVVPPGGCCGRPAGGYGGHPEGAGRQGSPRDDVPLGAAAAAAAVQHRGVGLPGLRPADPHSGHQRALQPAERGRGGPHRRLLLGRGGTLDRDGLPVPARGEPGRLTSPRMRGRQGDKRQAEGSCRSVDLLCRGHPDCSPIRTILSHRSPRRCCRPAKRTPSWSHLLCSERRLLASDVVPSLLWGPALLCRFCIVPLRQLEQAHVAGCLVSLHRVLAVSPLLVAAAGVVTVGQLDVHPGGHLHQLHRAPPAVPRGLSVVPV
jgi:hypothetical protein